MNKLFNFKSYQMNERAKEQLTTFSVLVNQGVIPREYEEKEEKEKRAIINKIPDKEKVILTFINQLNMTLPKMDDIEKRWRRFRGYNKLVNKMGWEELKGYISKTKNGVTLSKEFRKKIKDKINLS